MASAAALSLPMLAAAADLRIGGTGNALGTMRLLGEAYTRANPETRVLVLNSIGSSGAIKAVPKGAIEIGVSSRPLSDEEAKDGTTATEYAQSPTVLAVHKNTKVTSITSLQLADIYSGKMISWPDGSRVRPVMRQPGDDTRSSSRACQRKSRRRSAWPSSSRARCSR